MSRNRKPRKEAPVPEHTQEELDAMTETEKAELAAKAEADAAVITDTDTETPVRVGIVAHHYEAAQHQAVLHQLKDEDWYHVEGPNDFEETPTSTVLYAAGWSQHPLGAEINRAAIRAGL